MCVSNTNNGKKTMILTMRNNNLDYGICQKTLHMTFWSKWSFYYFLTSHVLQIIISTKSEEIVWYYIHTRWIKYLREDLVLIHYSKEFQIPMQSRKLKNKTRAVLENFSFWKVPSLGATWSFNIVYTQGLSGYLILMKHNHFWSNRMFYNHNDVSSNA